MISAKLIFKNSVNILKTTKQFKPIYFFWISLNFVFVLGDSYLIIKIPSIVLSMFTNHQIEIDTLSIIFFGIMLCGVGSAVCKYYYTPIALRVRYHLLYKVMEKNVSIPLSNYDDPKYLDDMQNIYYPVSSANGVEMQLTNFAELIANIAIITVSLGFMVQLNVVLMLIMFVWILLYSMISLKYSDAVARAYAQGSSIFREGNYIDDICLDVAYAKEIRVFQLSDWLLDKRIKVNKNFKQIFHKIYSLNARLACMDHIYQFIRDVLTYGFLIYLFFTKQITLPLLSSYCLMLVQLNICLSKLIKNLECMSKRAIEYPKLFNYIDIENEHKKGSRLTTMTDWNITFDHVGFHYPNHDTNIFQNLNVSIKKGDKIAVIGLNGAGKTTMMKLLMRLYQPTSGNIFMNGINIQSINLDDYYELFAPVFQEINIFPYTVKENLMFDQDGMSEEELDAVLKQVGLYDKLKDHGFGQSMTKYFDDQGLVLSGGEQLRFSLARALISKREILVLDEPTSALDAIAENKFYKQINHDFKDHTILFISHRLASTSFCDMILLLEDGGVSEVGTHAELMSKKGSYFKLFETQSKYYQEGAARL